MFDKIETISKSQVQHGSNNDRAFLTKIHSEENVRKLISRLDDLAIMKRYGKIVAIIPSNVKDLFLKDGFKLEATVPKFYDGKEPGCFMGKYFNERRRYLTKKQKKLINDIKESSLQDESLPDLTLPVGYKIVRLTEENISEATSIYKKVFQFYPLPIFKKSYLLEAIKSNVQYFGVYYDDKLIAVSAADMDLESGNAEMTDIATLPEFRGQNLSYFLLAAMQESMKKEGIKTVYTIARSNSHGINKTFARQAYDFAGTLVKNTFVDDKIESMNVWYKHLDAAE